MSPQLAEAISWIDIAEGLMDQAHSNLKAARWSGFATQAHQLRQQIEQLAKDIREEAA